MEGVLSHLRKISFAQMPWLHQNDVIINTILRDKFVTQDDIWFGKHETDLRSVSQISWKKNEP